MGSDPNNTDTAYLRLDDSTVVESVEVVPGIVLDFNEAEEVVGAEMLRPSGYSGE